MIKDFFKGGESKKGGLFEANYVKYFQIQFFPSQLWNETNLALAPKIQLTQRLENTY